MLIPPKYILTPKISQALQSIEACKEVINSITIPPEVELNIRRDSTLRSALFSARIEGNTLTLDEIFHKSSKDQKKQEVFNILKAVNWVYQRRYKDLSLKEILEIHKMVMLGLTDKSDLGIFRLEVGAIFNKAGIAIYLPPRPSQILSLMEKLLKFIGSPKEQFVPIKACLAHYTFEKIHPFLDGNGRVGRLILQIVLQKSNYGMKGLLAIEEYLDKHRLEYYQALENSENDVTNYLEFMLEEISKTAEVAKEQVLEKQQADITDSLLPRRLEIFNIIKDHKLINFDQIRRRFLQVNDRTLRYDLKKLTDSGLIRKKGITKGVWYELTNY